MKRIFIVFLIFFTIKTTVFSQSDILFNHYMFNELTFNPAVAGSSPTFDISLLARQQWMGLEHSPFTQVLNAHNHFKNIGGLGMTIINDKLGFENSLNFKLYYAHHMQISRNILLSLGAGAGFINKTIDGSKLIYDDDDDLDAVYNKESRIKPDFNFGVELNTSKLTLGIASTHIEQSLGDATLFKVPRHFYGYAKYRIEASDKINIVPTCLVKSTVFTTQVDLNAIFFYDNKFWIGGAYRLDKAYVGIIGFNIIKDLKFSYSYDYYSGPISKYNQGSHEVMLAYAMPFGNKPMMWKSPRYFN